MAAKRYRTKPACRDRPRKTGLCTATSAEPMCKAMDDRRSMQVPGWQRCDHGAQRGGVFWEHWEREAHLWRQCCRPRASEEGCAQDPCGYGWRSSSAHASPRCVQSRHRTLSLRTCHPPPHTTIHQLPPSHFTCLKRDTRPVLAPHAQAWRTMALKWCPPGLALAVLHALPHPLKEGRRRRWRRQRKRQQPHQGIYTPKLPKIYIYVPRGSV